MNPSEDTLSTGPVGSPSPTPRRWWLPVAGAIAGFGAAWLLAWGLGWGPGGASRPMADPAPSGGAETTDAQAELWTCGMHPHVLEHGPGPCPICGMDLVPVSRGDSGPGGAPTGEAGAVVRVDPAVVQAMNVRSEPVERRDLSRAIRTVGYLEYDQQQMISVTTKYPGWVERVYVNYVGEPVRRGQPLFEIYSPELVQTGRELISALEFADRMSGAPEDARRRALALVDAARQRLGYWDVDPALIERLEASREPFRRVTVRAPSTGVVMKRLEGLEGRAVEPGMELYHVADLSSLWLSVEVFEDQLAWVREGSSAEVSLSYFPGETFTGRVRFIEPAVAEATRTVSLRLEVPNADRRLRAGMYATVVFAPSVAEDALAVRSSAILRTGERDLAVVDLGSGRFEPRELRLGPEGDGWVEVVEGLAEGERIVTSAQFLIDSESRLADAVRKLGSAEAQHSSHGAGPHGMHTGAAPPRAGPAGASGPPDDSGEEESAVMDSTHGPDHASAAAISTKAGTADGRDHHSHASPDPGAPPAEPEVHDHHSHGSPDSGAPPAEPEVQDHSSHGASEPPMNAGDHSDHGA